jgi:hypothetical protein
VKLSRIRTEIRDQLRTPVFVRLMEPRWQAWVILGAAALHLGASLLGLPIWMCPFKALTGLPCPGCGLGRGVALFLRRQWREALQVHAFAPLFLLGLVLLGVVSVLPQAGYRKVLGWMTDFEERTGLVTLILLALILYWIARLAILGGDFV